MNKESEQDVAATLIAMERAALDRWGEGDTSGFLEISAPDVEYFDPYIDKRFEREELDRHYEALRGKTGNNGYEVINPKVQKVGNVAVLTYNYVAHEEDEDKKMNITEVYRHDSNQWRIIHTHISFTKP